MALLAALIAQLQLKKEQLRRLNVCAANLGNLDGDFSQNQSLVEEPELMAKTWQGMLADTFLDYRDEMAVEYDEISNVQLALSRQMLSEKITQIELEIIALEASIAAERARLAVMRAGKD
jgi:hypothetical protein